MQEGIRAWHPVTSEVSIAIHASGSGLDAPQERPTVLVESQLKLFT